MDGSQCEQAAKLASRARANLVRAGQVDPTGLVLANGNRAGVGDRIVTPRNDRRLAEPDGLVANRDQWTVEAVGADGSLTVRRHHANRAASHMLPARYVAQHVELAYASTVYAAQGLGRPSWQVPDDPAARLEWSERAGTVAAYQEIVNGDPNDPLGARPGPGQRDARARWDAANLALHDPPVAADTVSDDQLRAMVHRAAELLDHAPPTSSWTTSETLTTSSGRSG